MLACELATYTQHSQITLVSFYFTVALIMMERGHATVSSALHVTQAIKSTHCPSCMLRQYCMPPCRGQGLMVQQLPLGERLQPGIHVS